MGSGTLIVGLVAARRDAEGLRLGRRAEPAPVLAGAIDPQHPHIASGLVASGVRPDLIECTPTASAEPLAHAGM